MPTAKTPRSPRTITEYLLVDGQTRVIAHRGFSARAPENTLASFRKAVEIGADMIELDVLLSKDGRLVVIHDDTLDRTTDGKGKVSEFTLAQLKRFSAGIWFSKKFKNEHIPTLREVFDLAKGKLLVNVEIKTEAVTNKIHGGIAGKVVKLIRRCGMKTQVIVSSFDPRALKQMRRLDPRIKTATLYDAKLQCGKKPEQIMRECGTSAFNLSTREVSPAIVRLSHAEAKPVAVYTVNDAFTMRKMISLGVDAIFTNAPDVLLKVLKRREGEG